MRQVQRGRHARRVVLGVLLPLLLIGLGSGSVAADDLADHLTSDATRQQLQKAGWPVTNVDGTPCTFPTNDTQCRKTAQAYVRKRQRLLQWSADKRRAILADPNTTEPQKNQALDTLRSTMLKRGKVIGRKYYAPVVVYLVESVNFTRRKSTVSTNPIRLELAVGVSPGSDKWQGAWSDIDLQGSPDVVDAFQKKLQKVIQGASVTAEGGYVTEHGLDITLHKMGRPGMEEYAKVGDSAYEQKIRVDADTPETAVFALMAKDQEGRLLVEVNDYMKKSEMGLKADPLALLQKPMELKGLAKGIYKALGASPMPLVEIQACLDRSGLQMDAGDFRTALEKLKLDGMAFTPESVGLTPENIQAFQKSIETLFVTCHERVRTQALAEMTSLRQKILMAESQGNDTEATQLRKRYIDSQIRMTESTASNRSRFLAFAELGGALAGLRGQIPAVHAQARTRRELVEFLGLMKRGRFQRRLAILVLNHIASKSPEDAKAALEAAIEMDPDGILKDDPEIHKLRADLEGLQKTPVGRPRLEREAALLAFANRCRGRVVKINAFLAADLRRGMTGRLAGAVVDKWGGVDEALAYWSAFKADGVEGLATEIVRFRFPLVENIVMGNVLLAGWEVVCMICPQAGIYYGATSYATRLTLLAVDLYWSSALESFLDTLYQHAEWKDEGKTDIAGVAVGKWKLVRTSLEGRPLLRTDFLQLADGAMLESVELETVLRLTVAREDPSLAALDAMARHPDVGVRLKRRFSDRYEARWDEVRKWWARETLARLEARKQAEDALLHKMLLPAMFRLDQVLRELEVEDLVRAQMYFQEYTKSEKAWMFWVSVRTWLIDGTNTLFSEADGAARRVVQQLAAKELRYLRQYAEVLALREATEKLTGLEGQKDGPLRQLTAAFFLVGKPEQDLRRARNWKARLVALRDALETQLLAIKQTFVAGAALDSDYDRKMLADILRERTWFEAWGEAHKVLTTWHAPEAWSTARDCLLVPGQPRAWKAAFLSIWDKAEADVRELARTLTTGKTATTFRRQHGTRADRLLAAFRAHYAGEARGQALVHVRLQEGTRKTTTPLEGCRVTWVATGEHAVEARPGTYVFRGLPPGHHRFLARAPGFRDAAGNPAAVATLDVVENATGRPPEATVYLRPDALGLVGTVQDERGAGIGHARIRLRGKGEARRVQAGSDGTFTFIPVETGTYRVTASAKGYRAAPDQTVEVKTPIRVGDGPPLIVFTLTPLLATVEILVVDGHGQRVEGAGVLLGDLSGTTDARGKVTFTDVRPQAAARLRVKAGGYVSLTRGLDVLPEQEPCVIRERVVLDGGVSLVVHVLDLDAGTGVEAAQVCASFASEFASAVTGVKGDARLTTIPPAFVYLEVSGTGFGTRGNIEVDLRNVKAGETHEETVFVAFGLRLDVLVKDEAGNLIGPAAVALDGGPDVSAPTGKATFEALKQGEHTIRAKAPGFDEARLRYTSNPADRKRDRVVLVLKPGRSITVEVRDALGALLRHPPSTIRLLKDGKIVATANGPVHLFAGLPPGRYLAGAVAPGAGLSLSRGVLLEASPAHETLVVKLGLLFTLRVLVLSEDAQGAPVPESTRVRLVGQGHTATGTGSHVQFDQMLPGTYMLEASAPGFETTRRNLMFPATEEGQILQTEVVLRPTEAAPPTPPSTLLDRIRACEHVAFRLQVIQETEKRQRMGGTAQTSTSERLGSLAGPRPQIDVPYEIRWQGRNFKLSRSVSAPAQPGREIPGTLEIREVLQGTLSADGKVLETFSYEYSRQVRTGVNVPIYGEGSGLRPPVVKGHEVQWQTQKWEEAFSVADVPMMEGGSQAVAVYAVTGTALEAHLGDLRVATRSEASAQEIVTTTKVIRVGTNEVTFFDLLFK